MTKRTPLTTTAVKKVLPYLIKFKQRHGYSPGLEQIAKAFKRQSSQTAKLWLDSLEAQGYIKIPRTKNGTAKNYAIQILTK